MFALELSSIFLNLLEFSGFFPLKMSWKVMEGHGILKNLKETNRIKGTKGPKVMR